jgi:hypothetical protein
MGGPGKGDPFSPTKEGLLADKSTQLVLAALGRAAADPAGVPLHGNKAQPGLFAGTALGKQAARHCLDEGYLQVLRTETRGKATVEVCAISDKGLAYLLGQVSPRQVLEDFLRVLEARQSQVSDLVAAARQMHVSLDALKVSAEHVLRQVRATPPPGTNGHAQPAPGSDAWIEQALTLLGRWQASGASEDYPLPDHYRQLQPSAPDLTIGRFHDGLRRLHDQGKIYLHPWTGPLHDLPEPPYALLVGHEIAYYASLR